MGSKGLATLTWNGQNFRMQGAPNLVNIFGADPKDATSTMGLNPTPISTVTTPAGDVTQTFNWGTILTQYRAIGDKLSVNVTIQNASSLTIYRYWFYSVAMIFPTKPVNPNNLTTFNLDAPSSVYWDYVSGVVDLVNEDVLLPLALGFWQATSPANTQWYISCYVDPGQNLNPNWPAVIRSIAPGASDTLTTSIRFGGAGAPEDVLAADIFSLYRSTYPKILTPAPQKPIARLSFTGRFRPTFPKNPRGWFNSSTVDVTTPQGVANFQAGLLSAADSSIAEMARVGAYGGVVWDIEGQQSDQSYIGDPAMAEILAPELIGVLDTFMGKFTAAGFPIGFTLRPQQFNVEIGVINVSGKKVTWVRGAQFQPSWAGDRNGGALVFGVNNYPIASVESPVSLTLYQDAGTASQIQYFYCQEINTLDPFSVMQKKIQYAYVRWGATLFYVDSTLDYQGNVTPADAFQQLLEQYPGVYIYPEWKSTRHYAYTYPWTDSVNGYTLPSTQTLETYPDAGGLIRVPGDEQIASVEDTLLRAVEAGSNLLFDGWYPHSGNDVVIDIYKKAASGTQTTFARPGRIPKTRVIGSPPGGR
jgi:hypothetical protein